MPENILKYSDVLNEINNNSKNKTLLLGNGFSIAYNPQRFSFTHLKESAIKQGILKEDSSVLKLFSQFNTDDFEKIIKLLNDYIKVEKILNPTKEHSELKAEIEQLKQHLVETITNNHPDTANSLSQSEYQHACNFIKDYNRIYTLNYDLLLYWVVMNLLSHKEAPNLSSALNINDGFKTPINRDEIYVSFENEGSSQLGIFYLHGALHLFDNRDEIIKLTFSKTDIPLKQQIKSNLDKEVYPVFISEGTSSEKKEKIIHNAYLNHCYRSLRCISGNLVIFGTLLKMNDQHIQEAICHNKCENIYIGLFEPKTERKVLVPFIEKLLKNPIHHGAGKKATPRNIKFFDSRSVDIWGHEC